MKGKEEEKMPRIQLGEQMPDFHVNTAFDGKTTISELVRGKRLTIFWILRYLGCTFCSYDIHQIAMLHEEFLERDAGPVVVLQNSAETIEAEMEKGTMPMPLICDVNCEIYDTLEIRATETKADRMPKSPEGIARLEEKRERVKKAGFVHGAVEGREQQLPAVIVTDSDRIVKYVRYAENSVDIPSVEEMLGIIRDMEQSGNFNQKFTE